MSGESLRARALRGSALTMMGFGGSNILRLISNLILTRILFPEAFGLMALVQVFLGGMQMFSDIGIKTSVIQNARGDDPNFLNTAWTLQICRGVLLWLGACALAPAAAAIYDEQMLLQLLPVVGLNSVINGFATTNVMTGQRHMRLGLQSSIQMICRVLGLVLMIGLAYVMQSVWALVLGTLIASVLRVILLHRVLPGIRNRLCWDRDVMRDLIGFGKYIFLSTIAGFLINQGDRAVLGAYISLTELGVYNIGLLLGTLPVIVARAIANRIVLPLYRARPPAKSAANRAALFKARRLVVGVSLTLTVLLSFAGITLIDFMYDARYALAGPMVAMFGLMAVPQVVFSCYDGALLASGDSKRFFLLLLATAVVQTVCLFAGITWYGIAGAIVAPGIAALATYPLRSYFLRHHHANDNLADVVFLTLGFAVNGLACWVNWDAIKVLIG